MQAGLRIDSPLSVSLEGNAGRSISFAIANLCVSLILRPGDRKSPGFAFRRASSLDPEYLQQIESALVDRVHHLGSLAAVDLHNLEGEIFLPEYLTSTRSLLGSLMSALVLGTRQLYGLELEARDYLPLGFTSTMYGQTMLHPGQCAASFHGGIQMVNQAYTSSVSRIYAPKGLYVGIFPLKTQNTPGRPFSGNTFTHTPGSGSLDFGSLVLGLERSDFSLIRECLQSHAWKMQNMGFPDEFPDRIKEQFIRSALGWQILGNNWALVGFFDQVAIPEELGRNWQISSGVLPQEGIVISEIDPAGAIIQ